jgi:hypothetical protein
VVEEIEAKLKEVLLMEKLLHFGVFLSEEREWLCME